VQLLTAIVGVADLAADQSQRVALKARDRRIITTRAGDTIYRLVRGIDMARQLTTSCAT
jgi:hypothetical protein